MTPQNEGRVVERVNADGTPVGGVPAQVNIEWTDPDGCQGMRYEDSWRQSNGEFTPPHTWDMGGSCAEGVGLDRIWIICYSPGLFTYRRTLIDPTGLRSDPTDVNYVCRA